MSRFQRRLSIAAVGCGLLLAVWAIGNSRSASAAPPYGFWDSMCHPLHWHRAGRANACNCNNQLGVVEGSWYWVRSPEQERRVVMNLYNRYCVRCHGVDGRGVWDIPDVPDFTNAVWQASRSDEQLARLTLEGRGAVMPAFRGTFTLEESWAMARYLRTFQPGTEISPPIEQPNIPLAPPSPAPPSQSSKMKPAKLSDARLVRESR